MKTESKPKYGIGRNVSWMVKLAWKIRKQVLLICLLTALAEVAYHVAQLYIVPEILGLVEAHASLSRLFTTILFFTAILFITLGVKEYLSENAMYPQFEVRLAIIDMIVAKCNTTSFFNTLQPDFIKMRAKAGDTTSGNQAATAYIWQGLTNLLKNIGGFLVYLTILSHLHIVLMLIVIVTCVAGFLVSKSTNNWIYRHREEEAVYYARKAYIREKSESVSLAKDIRIFGLQNWLDELLDHVHNVHLSFRLKAEKKWIIANITEAVLTMARNGIAYVYLVNMALTEGLSVSEFVLYFNAVSTFTTWVMGILQDITRLHQDSLAISTVREFLEYPESFRFECGDAIPSADAYELKLEQVSFRYPGAENDTLHLVDLVIRPGEKLAIVGLNGAGKTTLAKLLCGLLDPTQGRVLLNGIDIRKFNRKQYYELFSAVFQEFSVLDATVAENIAQTAKNIDYEKVNHCLKMAGLSKAIHELPNGLHTHVGREVFLDGVLFSGGQMQRLMLARALYKDGPLLMLDEPTAALDPIAENDIYMKYNDMTDNKTSVFISHRLASTRFCDRILFLADGKLAEEGTHESLLGQGGRYAELFDVQSRYYQEGKVY